jgi:hypothetical protein
LSGIEPAVGRLVAMIPAALLVLLNGILLLLALPCDKQRRDYALEASSLAMGALAGLLHTPPARKGQLSMSEPAGAIHAVTQDTLPQSTNSDEALKMLPESTQQAINIVRPRVPQQES